MRQEQPLLPAGSEHIVYKDHVHSMCGAPNSSLVAAMQSQT